MTSTTSFKVSPSVFNAFNICHRQAWLMSRQLIADQENTYLDIGRLISETTFKREKKEVYLADINAVIDMITKKNGQYFVAEIKKSSSTLETGIFQLKYYLYLLKAKQINIKGIIKIPSEKKSQIVELQEDDITAIESILAEADKIISYESAPKPERVKWCSKCAHSEFCWA